MRTVNVREMMLSSRIRAMEYVGRHRTLTTGRDTRYPRLYPVISQVLVDICSKSAAISRDVDRTKDSSAVARNVANQSNTQHVSQLVVVDGARWRGETADCYPYRAMLLRKTSSRSQATFSPTFHGCHCPSKGSNWY